METKKIVINSCFGGFGLSKKALELLQHKKGSDFEIPYGACHGWGIDRWDSDLVAVVEELGKEADGRCAELVIIEVQSGRQFIINEYDGAESLTFTDEVDWTVL